MINLVQYVLESGQWEGPQAGEGAGGAMGGGRERSQPKMPGHGEQITVLPGGCQGKFKGSPQHALPADPRRLKIWMLGRASLSRGPKWSRPLPAPFGACFWRANFG